MNVYLKYSGMGIQMMAIVALGAFAGVKLDEWLELKKFPAFTVFLSLFSIAAAMYLCFKEATKK